MDSKGLVFPLSNPVNNIVSPSIIMSKSKRFLPSSFDFNKDSISSLLILEDFSNSSNLNLSSFSSLSLTVPII